MSSLAAIIAATLSLTSPTNYVWTTPPASNYIQGVGIGTKGAYVVPRLEDVAFLDEAYTELDHARGTTWQFAIEYEEGLPPVVQPVGQGVFDWEDIYHYSTNSDYVAGNSMFPLTFAGWGQVGATAWTHPGIFVSPNFSLDSQAGMAVADTNWCVNGISTSETNGLAFLTRNTFQSCILPARTNSSLMGAMALWNVTNAYYNAALCGPVLGVGQGTYLGDGEPTPILLRQAENGGGGDTTTGADLTYETYTYPNYQTGGTGTGRRLVSVTPQSPVESVLPTTTQNLDVWQNWSIKRINSKTRRHEYSYETLYITADGHRVTTNNYIGAAWISAATVNDWRNRPTLSSTNRMEMSHYCLSTNAVKEIDLIDGVDFIIVAQMRIDLSESLYAYSAEDYTTNRATARGVAWVRDNGASLKSQGANEPWPVYVGNLLMGSLLRAWFQQAAALVPSPTISDSDVPDPASLHPLGTTLPVEATLTRTITLTVEKVWRYPLIHRHYNAYFTED